MSLAADILRRAAALQEQPQQPAPVKTKPKRTVMAISNNGLHLARVPGCQRRLRGWEVTVHDGVKGHPLGAFSTLARARLAWRLWHLWRSRGYDDIPNGSWCREPTQTI